MRLRTQHNGLGADGFGELHGVFGEGVNSEVKEALAA